MHQVKDSLENCQDLDAAYTALRGEKSLEAQTPVTASAVTNVLSLLISGPQLRDFNRLRISEFTQNF